MTITSKPASKEYRDNWPFGSEGKEIESETTKPELISKTESVFIVARSLADARMLYMGRLGNPQVGYSNINEACGACKNGNDVWLVELKITWVRRA